MAQELWAVRRKADGAFFPVNAGRPNFRSWIEFPDPGEEAVLPPRTFTSAGTAKMVLRNWLKGTLWKTRDVYGDVDGMEYRPEPGRGVFADYEIVGVKLEVVLICP